MANADRAKTIEHSIIKQVDAILLKIFDDGMKWLKEIPRLDPRREQYLSTRPRGGNTAPSVEGVVKGSVNTVSSYIKKTADGTTDLTHQYLIVRPDNPCLDDKVVALIRPVLRTNKDNEPCLNFHVWFHYLADGQPPMAEHLILGWRLEGPEGSSTTHNYFHAQPLKKFGTDGATHGVPKRQSEKFPTIPLPASNIVELCLTAVLMASGKEAIRSFVRSSPDRALRESASKYWTKVFGAPDTPSTDPVP